MNCNQCANYRRKPTREESRINDKHKILISKAKRVLMEDGDEAEHERLLMEAYSLLERVA